MAAVTHESIPPLTRTTALGLSVILSQPLTSHAVRGWMPNEFVQLQSEPHGQAVSQNPLGKKPRIKPVPGPIRVRKDRREQHLADAPDQFVRGREIFGEFVIPAASDDEFNFVLAINRLQVVEQKCAAFTRIGTF